MRLSKIMLIILIMGILAVPLVSCSSETDTETAPENQVVVVQRGNLVVDITASGNLALSLKEDLAFQISGTTQEPLTVEDLLVEEGDSIREGQVIAVLDTTYLEQALKTAERAVSTAGIDLETATDSYRQLTYPYDYRTFTFDVPAAIASNNNAQRELKNALEIVRELGLSREQYSWEQYWDVFTSLQRALDNMIKARENLTRGYGQDVFDSGILPMGSYWTLRAAQLQMDKAQLALDKAGDDLDTAEDRLGKAVIVAPFDGFITTVNVDGGDEVKKGTVAVQLADPNKFEAEVMVSEMDIFQLKLGVTATVQIDAVPGLTLPAKVTHISPTATIQSGVVNYSVKVEIESLEAVLQQRQQARQGKVPTMLLANLQLKEGLTVTVSIIVEEKSDVLLLPNSAIITQGRQTYAQVLSPDGTIEERAITTGISNWMQTEIIDGLTEGEKVVAAQGTATNTPTSQSGGHLPFMPRRPPR